MQEALLHFLWQFGYFKKNNLFTVAGEVIQILHPGYLNTDARPDFSQARIKIGQSGWIGNVEIHINSSDWQAHKHHLDSAYDHVILHVVWKHDMDIFRKDDTPVPTLVLADKTPKEILTQYNSFVNNSDEIPCSSQFVGVKDLYKIQSLEKALMQRLALKAEQVKSLLEHNQNDWEETTYQLLARNMGFKLNSEPFLQLAKAIPLKLLHKHADQLLSMEALLFGQAGFLDKPLDEPYYIQLQNEYKFLAHKYNLTSSKLPLHVWKYLRLRPANFPTLRIAHLAALIQAHRNLFSLFIQTDSPKAFVKLLHLKLSDYWQEHYIFGKTSSSAASLGKESIKNILINTVVPIMVCYGREKGNNAYIERAIALLEALPAENNYITRIWKNLGLSVAHAYDAQGSIELYNHYCTQKKCLSCPVGISLLKPAKNKQTI